MAKKRTVVIFLIALFQVPNLICQEYQYVPFPDSNAIWSEVYYPGTDAYGYNQPAVLERFAIPGEDYFKNPQGLVLQ